MTRKKKLLRWVWMATITFGYIYLGVLSSPGASAQTTTTHTARFWLQAIDSCRQAIPGARFQINGHGFNVAAGPTPGTKPRNVGPGTCPIQRGNCVTVPTGCVSWNVPIPASGSLTYKITETAAPPNYVPCTGGSVCPGGPVTVAVTISSTGAFSARVRNVYPDRTVVVWPTSGAPYTGRQTDPAVVHNFQLGTGDCDGDHDADDHLTGGRGSHCDSDDDRS